MQAAESDQEHDQLSETNSYQFVSSHMSLAKRILASGMTLAPEGEQALMNKIFGATSAWVAQRDRLSVSRIPPLGLRV